jgi:uncharacterized membrane protein YpjA
MNKYLKIVGYGILIWLIPFLISFIIFPLREENRALFESIMPVTLTIIVLIVNILYFKKLKSTSIQEGIQLGIIWFIINIIIDLVLFLPDSPMQMTLTNYFMDIGLTYIIIIVIPICISYLLSIKAKK